MALDSPFRGKDPRRAPVLAPVVLVLLLAIAGCGGQAQLNINQRAQVARINAAFAGNALDGSHFGEALDGTDELIALCRRNPDAIYEGHESVKQVLEDDANTIRQNDPGVAAQLDRVLDDKCS